MLSDPASLFGELVHLPLLQKFELHRAIVNPLFLLFGRREEEERTLSAIWSEKGGWQVRNQAGDLEVVPSAEEAGRSSELDEKIETLQLGQ